MTNSLQRCTWPLSQFQLFFFRGWDKPPRCLLPRPDLSFKSGKKTINTFPHLLIPHQSLMASSLMWFCPSRDANGSRFIYDFVFFSFLPKKRARAIGFSIDTWQTFEEDASHMNQSAKFCRKTAREEHLWNWSFSNCHNLELLAIFFYEVTFFPNNACTLKRSNFHTGVWSRHMRHTP